MENIDWSVWYFESVCTITESHVTINQPFSFEYFHLTYNKLHIHIIYSSVESVHVVEYFKKHIMNDDTMTILESWLVTFLIYFGNLWKRNIS